MVVVLVRVFHGRLLQRRVVTRTSSTFPSLECQVPQITPLFQPGAVRPRRSNEEALPGYSGAPEES